MKNLYIDFDGVIMNTIETTYVELVKLGIDPDSEEDKIKREEYYRDLDWNDLLNNKAEIINDGMNCIKKLIDSGKFNVSILSHVNSLLEAEEKIKYIRRFLPDITFIPVPRHVSKTIMIKTKDAILVDDFGGNLKEWKEEGGIGIKFSTKLNGKGFIVIDKLDQILEMTFI